MTARRVLVPLVLALVALTTIACSDGGGTYRISGLFPQAVALFEESGVQVMGVQVGHVESIDVEGELLRITMQIDDDVRLPTDVQAAITPVSLIGERNIVLTPAWQPGDEQAGPDFEIPRQQIVRVVEPDDVLNAITTVVKAVDPERIAQFLGDTAATLDGNGELINRALDDSSQLLDFLATRDDDLLDTADQLRTLAASLNQREAQLQQLFDAYARATDILASERESVQRLLTAMQELVDEGGQVMAVFDEDLASNLSDLLQVQLRIEANADSINQFIAALPDIADLVVDAYDPGDEALTLLLDTGESLDLFLGDLVDLGLVQLPCVPAIDGVLPCVEGTT